ncbi:hypothetical protein Poli38472_003353 [Pythium oligandrum]|uniref:DNA mismatch repair proteins mutS family domain-containing protein n=1 Tax=Pythium oligandrum TaxID=41045 RepID=A0A8K1C711_PYTOL|nr:hypothetical protein Poli38472_003353 [Pythium oligandrum]|eukprot:TMW57428.1 hypothetical protein Poli38472_003353 [Pythium oligandrum]
MARKRQREEAQALERTENVPPALEMEQDDELMCMAILYDRGQLGAAIYDAVTARLKTIQLPVPNLVELGEVVGRMLTQFEVHRVLVSSRNASTHGLLQVLKSIEAKQSRSIGISVRKHAEFNYLKACNAIERIRMGDTWWNESLANQGLTRREAYKYLGRYFDFESTELIRATGALFGYLATEKIGAQLDGAAVICLTSVERVALDGIMYIDAGSMKSLQIFSNEAHPSLVKGYGRSKEGFSLYGLLNRTLTKGGAALLRQWMLAPLLDVAIINMRLDAVEYLCKPDVDELRKAIRARLKCFGDVSGIFNRIRSRCASVSEWNKVSESIGSYLALQNLLQEHEASQSSSMPPLLCDILGERSMIHVSNLLGNIIDFEESAQEEHIVIRAGVSDVLDAARAKYEDLDNVLTEVAYQIQESQPSLSSITVQYIPQVGYVICCEAATALPDFVFQFQEDDTTFYYKDSCCRDLDATIGDIFGFILDLQRDLLEELTVALLQYEHCIFEMAGIVSKLDCISALADVAKNFNYRRPTVTEENEFMINTARHPLQELIVDQYIPNDTKLSDDRVVMVVTGQNGSGKSVYLKMVGLLQYMAQIGSYVPAHEAQIGIVRKMFTRIHSMETASISQSSFTIDCNQIVRMLQHGQERSLFLIDEFGKGTAEADGTALLAATINYLVAKPPTERDPRVIITTHLLDIFRRGLVQTDRAESRVICTMMASASASSEHSPVPMFTPLHELRQGVSLASNALGCAINCGVPPDIVKRAADVLEMTKKCQPITRPPTSSQEDEWERQVLELFASVDNWITAPADKLTKLQTMIRMSDKWKK